VALQRALLGHVIHLTGSLEASRLPRFSLPPRYLTTKLGAGIPALTGERIPLPTDALAPTLVSLSQALAQGGGGEATKLVVEAVESGRLDLGALLTLGFRREQAALRAVATRAGLGHDLLWLVVDLAASPFAVVLLEVLYGALPPDSPLEHALHDWSRGYCPLCGSWPTLVEDLAGTHRLRCSFCAAAWDVPNGACVYCGDRSDAFTVLTPDPARPGRTLELCRGCRGYTKVITTDESLPFPLVALADLESMDLDLAAMQHGCARPAIKQFAARR